MKNKLFTMILSVLAVCTVSAQESKIQEETPQRPLRRRNGCREN